MTTLTEPASALTFLPLFLQVVQGVNPTESGLRLLPMMLGLLLTSISSGVLISRTGRYKIFPIAGTALMSIGLYLLSSMDTTTSIGLTSVFMFVLGVGIGGVMQVLVIVVQSAVGYEDLGVATSGATFFRSIGGSFGTAVFGTIFATEHPELDALVRRLAHSLLASDEKMVRDARPPAPTPA
ncbi:MAG: MFS transporter [Nocardioidaceae bacterium]